MTAPLTEPRISIGDRTISADQPCYVIAEIGVNHNGDMGIARKLVEAAAGAGADAAKFQTFRTANLVTRTAEKAQYQQASTGDGSQAEMLAALELSADDFAELRDLCESLGMDFLSTAFDEESLDDVLRLRPKAIKWPSGEIDNHPFLQKAGAAGLPVILSTGMADLKEVAAAVSVLRKEGCADICILQCVSNYPAPIEEQNLRTIPAMSREFGVPAGFSDHTEGSLAAIAARGLGMAVLEKHITLDRNMPGPDHGASIEVAEFAALVADLRKVEASLGDGIKRPVRSEMPTREVARRSLVYAADLPAGTELDEGHLTAKRPGRGVSPANRDNYIGRRLLRSVCADQQLEVSDFE